MKDQKSQQLMCSLFRTLQGIVRGQPTHLTTVRMRLSKKGKIQFLVLVLIKILRMHFQNHCGQTRSVVDNNNWCLVQVVFIVKLYFENNVMNLHFAFWRQMTLYDITMIFLYEQIFVLEFWVQFGPLMLRISKLFQRYVNMLS